MNYDEDYNDPSQRCEHGTFIGSWWGPDYICGACESGEPEPRPMEVYAARLRIANKQARDFDRFVKVLQDVTLPHSGWIPGVAEALMEHADTPIYRVAAEMYTPKSTVQAA